MARCASRSGIIGSECSPADSPSDVTIEALDQHDRQVSKFPATRCRRTRSCVAAAGTGNKLDYEIYGNITMSRGIQKTLPFQAQGVA